MDNYKAKKSLGQNFLIDNNVLDKIVNLVNPSKKDLIIEIGPGKGYLTKRLKEFNSLLVCYEIDTDMKDFLNIYESSNTKIIYQDFLDVKLNDELKKYEYENIYIVANIPYYITTAIIKKIALSKINFNKIVLMVEDELADRFCAKAKDSSYSGITVFLNYYFNLKKEFVVPNTCFEPKPKINSAIITLIPSDNQSKNLNIELFNKLVHDAFLHRRKTLKNNLKAYDLDKISKVLEKYNCSLNNRPQDIDVKVYMEIAKIIG